MKRLKAVVRTSVQSWPLRLPAVEAVILETLCVSLKVSWTCVCSATLGHWPGTVEVTLVNEKKKRHLRLHQPCDSCVVRQSVHLCFPSAHTLCSHIQMLRVNISFSVSDLDHSGLSH